MVHDQVKIQVSRVLRYMRKEAVSRILVVFIDHNNRQIGKTIDEIKNIRFSEIKHKSGLHDIEVRRVLRKLEELKLVTRIEINPRNVEYVLNLNEEQKEYIKHVNRNKPKFDLEKLFMRYTDQIVIENYEDDLVLGDELVRIYGMKQGMIPAEVSLKELFQDRTSISYSEMMYKIMKHLENMKKQQSEARVAEIIKEHAKENLKIAMYSRLWTKYLLMHQFLETTAKQHLLEKNTMLYQKNINYKNESDEILARSLIPKKDRHKSLTYLKETYPSLNYFFGFFISQDEATMLQELSKEEALKIIAILRKISDQLVNEGIYPFRIAMVAHSSPGLYNSIKRVKKA